MSISTRIQTLLLIIFISTFYWYATNSEFTYETCVQLNSTVNITCIPLETQYTIVFNNEDRIKIYISSDYQSYTISCHGTDEEVLEIGANLFKMSLGSLNDIVLDGCLPFENIFERLGISIGGSVKVQRGVTYTPLKRKQLIGLTALKTFVLSGFDELDADVLSDFQALETLELTRFDAPLPSDLLMAISAHLLRLHMRENQMQKPPARIFSMLHSLEALDLSFNELNEIPSDTFANLHNLMELDLSNNALTQLPVDVFETLRNLTVLYLSNNRLKQLELGIFAKLSNLLNLQMENNALHIDASIACSIFDGLTTLEYLELANNALSVYCLPHRMGSVRVNLSYNHIGELLVHAGENQPRLLVNLDVRNNRLQYLSSEVLQYLHDSFAQLSLAHNPWQCDCASVLLLNYVKLNSKRVADLEQLSCADGMAVGKVTQLTTSDICKSMAQTYYLVAIAVLSLMAVLALLASLAYRRAARSNARKRNSATTADSELSIMVTDVEA